MTKSTRITLGVQDRKPRLAVHCLRTLITALALSATLLWFPVSTLRAGTFGTTLTVCPSGCDYTTIQAAVFASDPGDTVEVQVAGAHTEGPIQIFDDVTIAGLGRNTTFVQQAVSLDLADRSVFQILFGANVTIRDMTIRHGRDSLGGCVFNLDGDLLLLDVNVSNCQGGKGGGILNRGSLTLTESTVTSNLGGRGGGIYNDVGALLSVNSSSIDNNESYGRGGGVRNLGAANLFATAVVQNFAWEAGGGIDNFGGSLDLELSRIDENTLDESAATQGLCQGGGIYSDGPLMVRRSSVSSNTTTSSVCNGGGLYLFDGGAQIESSTIASNFANEGGGLYLFGGGAQIDASTIADNSARRGGGLFVGSTLDLTNTTLSGNSARWNGGGIFVTFGSETRLANVTITDNTADSDHDNSGNGGGIFNTDGEARILNSLLAGNTDGSDVFHVNGTDCYGDLTSDGHNLIGSLGSSGIGRDPVCFITGFTIGNTIGVAAELGPLTDNGGPTLTHALLAGSPAIDTGDPASCLSYDAESLTTDQRGYLRQNRCDRGAFELGALPPDLIFADGFESGSTSRWTGSQ